MSIDLLAAFTLGLFGSMHCIGMCGPLVLAVPTAAEMRIKYFLERVLYNIGRVITYALMGAILGLLGTTMSFAGIQQDISIVIGISILLTVLVPIGIKTKLHKYSPLVKVYALVKRKFGELFQRRGLVTLFTMGLLNGLLPCGLVYTALIGAAAVGEIGRSALFMGLFGIGTMPALVGLSMAGKMISMKFRSLFSKAVPFFSILVAVILILRGMNLGIPMISPKVHQLQHQQELQTQPGKDCCE